MLDALAPWLSLCACAQLLILVQLSAAPWTAARQALLFMELSRQEYWSGLSFPSPGALPHPGTEPELPASPALRWSPASPALRRSLYLCATWGVSLQAGTMSVTPLRSAWVAGRPCLLCRVCPFMALPRSAVWVSRERRVSSFRPLICHASFSLFCPKSRVCYLENSDSQGRPPGHGKDHCTRVCPSRQV